MFVHAIDGIGRSPAAAPRFTCPAPIKSSLTTPGAASSIALQTAIDTAVNAISRAADSLTRGTRSAATVASFRDVFGVDPTWAPSWRPAGKSWDVGDIVRRRLQRAAEILTGGYIQFECTAATSVSTSSPGRYRIGLGSQFWEWATTGNHAGVIHALLAAALRIYFGPRLHHENTGLRRERTNCYSAYVLMTIGLPVPPALRAACGAAETAPPSTSTGPRRKQAVNLFPMDVVRESWRPETLKQRVGRIIKEAPPIAPPKTTPGKVFWEQVDSALDRAMDRTAVPAELRPLIVQGVHAAIEKGTKEILDRVLEETGVRGEAAEAVRGALKRATQQQM